jgi:hypothetical protein
LLSATQPFAVRRDRERFRQLWLGIFSGMPMVEQRLLRGRQVAPAERDFLALRLQILDYSPRRLVLRFRAFR